MVQAVHRQQPQRIIAHSGRLDRARTATAVGTAAKSPVGFAFVVFCLYTFVLVGRPQDYLPALAPFRLALVLTLVAAAATVFGGGHQEGSIFRHTETKLYYFLFAVMCIGIPFSIYRRASFNFV